MLLKLISIFTMLNYLWYSFVLFVSNWTKTSVQTDKRELRLFKHKRKIRETLPKKGQISDLLDKGINI